MSKMKRNIEEIVKNVEPVKAVFIEKAYERINNLTKPVGSLGRLEEVAAKLYAVFEGQLPDEIKKAVYVFAADHGVTEEGVSAYPKEVTYQMVHNFLTGGAAINVFSRAANAKVYVIDVGVDYLFDSHPDLIIKKIGRGTGNILKTTAMTREQAMEAIITGFQLAEDAAKKGYNLLAPGDMGIGNTTASSAVIKAVTGYETELLVGFGTGIDEEKLARKIEVVDRAIEFHKPESDDALDVLQKVGGFEIGAICGFILGAACYKKPVVVDGFISAAGFILAWLLNKNVSHYAIFSHCSLERGHKLFYSYINEKPLLDLNLRLGEGTGSVIAFPIIEMAVKMFKEMATFAEAAVSGKMS